MIRIMIRKSRGPLCRLPPVGRSLLGLLLGCTLLLPLAARAAPSPHELLDAGRADDALRMLTPQAAGNNAAAFNYLCRVYFSLGDWDNAVQHCERATQLDPGNAAFQLWLGRSYGEKANAVEPAYRLPAGTQNRGFLYHCALTRSPQPRHRARPRRVLCQRASHCWRRQRQSSRPGRRIGSRASRRCRLGSRYGCRQSGPSRAGRIRVQRDHPPQS